LESLSQKRKEFRAFKSLSHFSTANSANYYLLPFRFAALNTEREVLVNEVGDYLTVPRGTAQRIVERRIEPEEELYADLTANFFISQTPVPPLIDVLATRYRTKKSFLDDFTALHIFVLTLRCEHTCHYCQVSRVTQDKSAFDMSYDHLDKGIELMMQSPNPNVTLEFQGGEPLLAFEKIVYAVRKAKSLAGQLGKQLNIVICSNLAPLTEDILAFCREHEILLSTSIDGPINLHNANRKRPGNNSYELAVKGIERARQVLGEEKVSALMTTASRSLDYPIEIVDEYVKLGFKNIFLRPISPYGFARRNVRKNNYETEIFLKFYKKALEHILAYNRQGYHLVEDYASIILRKILTPFPVGYVDLQSPSGLINSVVLFNYNGKVYASDEARMLAEMQDDTFCLGDLDNDSYEDIFYGPKAYEIAQNWSNESLTGCSDCAFQSYCGADPVYHHATQGDMAGYRPDSGFCQKNMEIIRYLLELMDTDREVLAIFSRWVSNC
jgi:His-Xaa-Ser system radical SAM maturase HxsB